MSQTSASQDHPIAAIASRQHGNITRLQLVELGLSRDQIVYRVQLGRLYRVHRGVYSVGRPPKTPLERASAAVFACGPGAALSHSSALALWDLGQWPWTMAVTAPTVREHKGIQVHTSDRLLRRDFRHQSGIRVTSVARTLLDCAPNLRDRALARAVNDGRRRKNVRLAQLADIIGRFPRHPGARRLAPFAELTGGPTRSGWEDDFPAFCRHFGLPAPVMAATVAGWEVDALFPQEKVIVELDGWEFHSNRQSFEDDRERDACMLAAGYVTLRVTWTRMHERARREAVRLHGILRQRRELAAA